MARLGDYIQQIRGVSYKPDDLSPTLNDDFVPLLRANNIVDGELVLDDLVFVNKSKVSQTQYLRRGDILICTSSGSKSLVGKAALVRNDLEMTFGAFCKVIRCFGLRSSYIGYYFQSPIYRETISAFSAGANINNIRNEHIDELQIRIPTTEKQDEIIKAISFVYKLIFLRKQQLAKLDELIKARFVEMFGDCKINPKGWNTVSLGEIANVGSSKRVFVEELKDKGIPFFRGTEVGALAEGKPILPELFITEEHYRELVAATGKPEIGDLLMPSICPDGRIWVVDNDEPFYFKDGRVLWVHLTSDKYDPVFLLYTLKDRIMTDYSSIASGTTFAELKIFALKQCQVFDVPIEQQRRFVGFINQINKSKNTVQQSLDKLETLKAALMQQFFG